MFNGSIYYVLYMQMLHFYLGGRIMLLTSIIRLLHDRSQNASEMHNWMMHTGHTAQASVHANYGPIIFTSAMITMQISIISGRWSDHGH